eukprot:1138770-Pelagomonas_calceolata.AAC.16
MHAVARRLAIAQPVHVDTKQEAEPVLSLPCVYMWNKTGTGCTRALIATLEHKADLINMSFGEPTTTPNGGRFIDLANEVVHKHGVIFVSSAGNAGPALTTVGAPGGISPRIFLSIVDARKPDKC